MEKQNGQPIKGFWESMSFNLMLKSVKSFADLVENEQNLETFTEFAKFSPTEREIINLHAKLFGKEYKPGQKDKEQIVDIFSSHVKLFKKGFVIFRNALYSVKERKSIPDTSGFKKMVAEAFLNNESDYFIVEAEKGYAILNKTGDKVTDWFDYIYSYGLADGKTDYYVASKQQELYIGKLGNPNLIGPFKEVKDFGFVKDPTKNTITVETLDGQQTTVTRQEVEEFLKEKELEDER
jgi:hypothetical protein